MMSTPIRCMDNVGDSSEMITINTSELNKILSEAMNEKLRMVEADFEIQLKEWQRNVLTYTNDKLNELTSHVRYMQGRYFHSDFNNRYKSHMELEQELEMFGEGLASLLHADTVQEQYPIYAEELEDLRRRFHEQQTLNRQ